MLQSKTLFFFKTTMLETKIIVVISFRLNLNFKQVFPSIFRFQEESLLETQGRWQALERKPVSYDDRNHSAVL